MGSEPDLVTVDHLDARGNVVRHVDANLNETMSVFDESGRLVRVTSPEVALDGTATLVQPDMEYGYSAFGDQTEVKDPRGNVTASFYDRLGRLVRVNHPSYTDIDSVVHSPFETFAYDKVGNKVSQTSRRGATTNWVFDSLNRAVRQTDPAATAGGVRGVFTTSYDLAGRVVATVDQTGARSEFEYDDLDRVRRETSVVRNGTSTPDRFVSAFDYDDLGNQVWARDSLGNVTRGVYNAASDLVVSYDELGEATRLYYEFGRVVSTRDPLGRVSEVEYDSAGRAVESRQVSASGVVLARSRSVYDALGNVVAEVGPRGFDGGDLTEEQATTSFSYDALNRLVGVSQPVSSTETITTSYGYDLAGNLSRLVDGRGNTTLYSYNSWNLLESTVEPSTVAYPNLADRTYTTVYDDGGLPVADYSPGGVSVVRSFDCLGRLVSESGSGDGPVVLSYSYDLAGRRVSVVGGSGTIGVVYDDRGLVTADLPPVSRTGCVC